MANAPKKELSPVEQIMANRGKLKIVNVKVQSAGQVYKEVVAYMPKGMIYDDLKDFTIFSKVQSGQLDTRLNRLDRVRFIEADFAFEVWATVAHVNGLDVSLSDHKRQDLRVQTEALPTDEDFRCEQIAGQYYWFRKKDSQKMTQGAATIGQVLRDLETLRPRKVA